MSPILLFSQCFASPAPPFPAPPPPPAVPSTALRPSWAWTSRLWRPVSKTAEKKREREREQRPPRVGERLSLPHAALLNLHSQATASPSPRRARCVCVERVWRIGKGGGDRALAGGEERDEPWETWRTLQPALHLHARPVSRGGAPTHALHISLTPSLSPLSLPLRPSPPTTRAR